MFGLLPLYSLCSFGSWGWSILNVLRKCLVFCIGSCERNPYSPLHTFNRSRCELLCHAELSQMALKLAVKERHKSWLNPRMHSSTQHRFVISIGSTQACSHHCQYEAGLRHMHVPSYILNFVWFSKIIEPMHLLCSLGTGDQVNCQCLLSVESDPNPGFRQLTLLSSLVCRDCYNESIGSKLFTASKNKTCPHPVGMMKSAIVWQVNNAKFGANETFARRLLCLLHTREC